jgi:hypothetical protein
MDSWKVGSPYAASLPSRCLTPSGLSTGFAVAQFTRPAHRLTNKRLTNKGQERTLLLPPIRGAVGPEGSERGRIERLERRRGLLDGVTVEGEGEGAAGRTKLRT